MDRELMEMEKAKEYVEILKQRAEQQLKEEERKKLLKTRIFAELSFGFDNNVTADSSTKGDFFTEKQFFFNWLPTFNKNLGLDANYWLINTTYSEETDLTYLYQGAEAGPVYYPFDNKSLSISPGAGYEWAWYINSKADSYTKFKQYLRFRHYLARNLFYGGEYEHSDRAYNNQNISDINNNELAIKRQDNRHTLDLYLVRYLGDNGYIKLRGKAYINDSNFQFSDFYDYDSLKGFLAMGRTFFNNKLNVVFTPSFEKRNYKNRVAVDTARYENIMEYNLVTSYSLRKNLNWIYKFNYRKVGSNDPLARYTEVTNSTGVNMVF